MPLLCRSRRLLSVCFSYDKRLERQLYYKSGAARKIVFYPYVAAVVRNYVADDGQAEPGAGLLGRKVRLKEPLLYLGRYAGAVVHPLAAGPLEPLPQQGRH